MTTPDPEPRRVEPTGNPRVDALIDAMVCPSCRTIYNAAKAKCDDPWHYDNQPDVTPYAKPSTFEAGVFATGGDLPAGALHPDDCACGAPPSFVERLKAAMATQRITVLPPSESEREQAAYERGVAEGRRKATEAARELPRRWWWPDLADARQDFERLVGPREPAEQATVPQPPTWPYGSGPGGYHMPGDYPQHERAEQDGDGR